MRGLSSKFEPITGVFKKILQKKPSKIGLDYETRNPKDWMTKLELLRGDIQNLNIDIYNREVITHILSNLPESYENIV